MHVVERLAEFAQTHRGRPIAPQVLHHAKRAVIDWHAALFPGARVAPAALLERALAEEVDHGYAHLALGRRATIRAAALINGAAAHTVEVDDIYRDGIYHPGAPTIAAALAVGQSRRASGEQFLRAVIVGYEISTRIAAAMGRAHYKYWHNTGTIGCFGAASAAAELLGLERKRFAHALATVATFSAGLQQAFRSDSMCKPMHAGRAAEAGVTAALAAAEGVTGSLDILEGEAGFGRAMGENPDWGRALATLGEEFHICRMTFKNHACCGHAFAAIDGALALKAQMKLSAAEIARVRVGGYRATLEVAGIADPVTAAEARFSTPYLVATALTHGSARRASPSTRATAAAASTSRRRARAIPICRSPTPSSRPSTWSSPRPSSERRRRARCSPGCGSWNANRACEARAGPVRPTRGRADRRFRGRGEEHRAPAALPEEARLFRPHRADQSDAKRGAGRARLAEPRGRARGDRPRFRDGAGRRRRAGARGLRQAQGAGDERLHRRLRRRGRDGHGEAEASRRARTGAGRAPARPEQHGPGRHSRAAGADRECHPRDGCAAGGHGEPRLAERHHARHAALARRRARAGIREARVRGQRGRYRRGRAGGDARRGCGDESDRLVSRDRARCRAPRRGGAPRARGAEAGRGLQARPIAAR